ncbi:MAG: hypothetical protein Q9162_003340 [Coniocarpon cinnabarinum]
MFSSSRKPYTAVTVQVERLTGPQYDENDLSGIIDLIEVIRIQDSGPTEAARALRKKLKYGSAHRQLRALAILDGLIQNAGGRFQRTFADQALLERLRTMPQDDMVDPEVREKCNQLFRGWAVTYKNTPGMGGIAMLYKQLPKRKKPTAAQSRVVRENDQEAARDNPFAAPDADAEAEEQARQSHARRGSLAPQNSFLTGGEPSSNSRPRASSSASFFGSGGDKKDKKKKVKYVKFSLEKERPNMLQSIASANMASTNLLNALKFVNRETQRVSDVPEVVNAFEQCKKVRRSVLRYIQLVETDQILGSLLSANDELVKALMAYEIMDKSVDDDSDSDAEAEPALNGIPDYSSVAPERMMAGLTIEKPPSKPPRPGGSSLQTTTLKAAPPPTQHFSPSDAEDEADPFGDHAAI